MSQNPISSRCHSVEAARKASLRVNVNDHLEDLDQIFRAQYDRIACVIARVIRNPARAEELAVEVVLRWSKQPGSRNENAEAWLYRTAVRVGLDELRREHRRARFEGLIEMFRQNPTPEEVLVTNDEASRVRTVLSAINRRHAELLLLRSEGFNYGAAADALGLHRGSVGTLLSRAQQTFRKEYAKRYGHP